MTSFLKHLGKKKAQFTFFVEVKKVTFPDSSGLQVGDNIVVSFEKGDNKYVQSSDHGITDDDDGNGHLSCTINESLSLDVSLYRDSNGLFQEKIGKVNVFQRRRGAAGLKMTSRDSLKSVGICSLPLHGLSDGKPYDKVLPLTWTSAEGALVYMTVTARPADENPDFDDDSSSIASSSSRVSARNQKPEKSGGLFSVSRSKSLKPDATIPTGSELSLKNLQSHTQQQNVHANTKLPTVVEESPAPATHKSLIDTSNQQNNSSIAAYSSANASNGNTSDEVVRLRQQIADLSNRLNQVQTNAQYSETNLTHELAQANKQIAELKKENARLQAEKGYLSSPSNRGVTRQASDGRVRQNSTTIGMDEDIDTIRNDRDAMHQKIVKLTQQLTESKAMADEARAEAIRFKVQMTALSQALEELKMTSRVTVMSLAQHATSLEIKLMQLQENATQGIQPTSSNISTSKGMTTPVKPNATSQSAVPAAFANNPFATTRKS